MISYSFEKPTKSLYIHWPFCANKCYYCDFVSFEQHENFYDLYHKALCNEIITFAKSRPQNEFHIIETIFFGGGTPSLYPQHLLQSLFTLLRDNFTIAPQAEITIEANPADINEENLTHWKMLGINRLSMGIQILNDDVLFKLNRRQRVVDAERAIKNAPLLFQNISVDLILGLPGTTESCWFDTLQKIVNWPITHVSLYFLTIHEKTPLFFKIIQGNFSTWPEERFIDCYEKSIEYLATNGFYQYEISNFSRQGFQSAHNLTYWNRLSYRGFGVSSASFDGLCRFYNDKNLEGYLSSAHSGQPSAFLSSERLTQGQVLMEMLMLGLRQSKGVDLRGVVYFLKDEQQKRFYQTVHMLKEQAFLTEHEGVIRLTTKGMILENEVILKLL